MARWLRPRPFVRSLNRTAPSLIRRIVRDAIGIIALAAVYAAVAKISLVAAMAHHVVSSIWPPAGIAVFALVRFGLGWWPGVAIGAFALNATSGISIAGALAIAGGNTVEAVVGAYLLTRVAHINRALDRVRDVLALVGFAGILSTMIAATVGVASLVVTGSADASTAAHLWLVWWTGDAVGILVVAPFLLTWTEPESDAPETRMRGLEQLIAFVALGTATVLLFQRWGGFFYLVFPMTTWIALRFGRRGAATAGLIVMAIATWFTIRGDGPFTAYSPLGNLFALQLFLAVVAAKSMLFAASRAETRSGQARLLETESRYRLLARNLPDACVVLYDRDIRLLLVEGPAIVAAGFTKDELEGRTLGDVFDPDHALALSAPFRLAFEGRTIEFEFSYNERTYLVRVLPLAEIAAAASFGMALALDITQRHAADREIAESRARLQALSRQLLAAQEDERIRVAREVHDELGQALTGIKLGLSALRNRPTRRPSLETDRRLDAVNIAIDTAIEAVRRIVLRLRPGVLDSLGPLAALEWEVQEFSQQAGLPVRLVLPPEPFDLDAERSTTLYRTVQEALTNVMRHANAKSVAVGLKVHPGALVLQVTDDGRGIAENELRNPRSMGILGMRERAMSCGGTLEVRRAEGGGTDVVLTVPYESNGGLVQ
jgi:PAS domain S-box-containing protein